MGALPKNKITRAERGKRRKGNTPTITKDAKTTAIPSHKRGFVAEMMRFLGMATSAQDTVGGKSEAAKAAKAARKDARKAQAGTTAQGTARPTAKRSIAPSGARRKQTQHKG